MRPEQLEATIAAHLKQVLREIQTLSGREAPPISDGTVPSEDLPGFDSINGIEATMLLSERLGVEIDNIDFFSRTSGRSPTIQAVVEAVALRDGNRILATVANPVGPGTQRTQKTARSSAVRSTRSVP